MAGEEDFVGIGGTAEELGEICEARLAGIVVVRYGSGFSGVSEVGEGAGWV